MENILCAVGDHCVAGVVTALAADHHIGGLGEVIDDLAFAFIAPLEAGNNGIHEMVMIILPRMNANGRELIGMI